MKPPVSLYIQFLLRQQVPATTTLILMCAGDPEAYYTGALTGQWARLARPGLASREIQSFFRGRHAIDFNPASSATSWAITAARWSRYGLESPRSNPGTVEQRTFPYRHAGVNLISVGAIFPTGRC